MDAQLKKNSQDLELVTVQIQRKNQSAKIADISLRELQENGSNRDLVWEGVGKMFLSSNIKDYEERLEADKKEIKDQLKNMEIKRNYLQTSVENTAKSMQRILTGKSSD